MPRQARTILASVGLLIGAVPLSAIDLYFNSYGWEKIYRTDSGDLVVDRLLPADIRDTSFLKSADFGGDGRLYGIGHDGDVGPNTLFAIDVSGPLTAWAAQYDVEGGSDYLAFDPDDRLWVAVDSTLRRVAPGGGTVPDTTVQVTHLGVGLDIWGIDFDSHGTLYAVDAAHLYRVDPRTGAAARIHSAPNLDGGIFTELDVGADGVIRMLGSNGYLYEYKPPSGVGAWRPGPLLFDGATITASSLASGAPASGAVNPRLVDFSYSPSTGLAELGIIGSPNTTFRLRQSANLQFDPGREVELIGASVGTPNGNTVTTDDNGLATVQFNAGMARGMFFRAEGQ